MANFILSGKAFQSPGHYLVFTNGNLVFTQKENEVNALQERYRISLDLRNHLLQDFIDLYQISIPEFPPEKYQKAYSTYLAGNEQNFEWSSCMPQSVYFTLLLKFAKDVSDILDTLNLKYWFEHYLTISKILYSNRFFNPAIDTSLFKSLYEEAAPTQKLILGSWNHNGDSDSNKGRIRYSLTKTKTGRLTVVSGPNILTLKKEYRKVFTSSFGKEGALWYFDYTSLEPRVLLATQRRQEGTLIGRVPHSPDLENISSDIYQKVIVDLNLTGKVSREIVKVAVLSVLYGQSFEHTLESLKEHVSRPEEFISMINEYFGAEEIRKRLLGDLAKTNGKYIENYYGRPVFVGDAKPYVLLNYYVQSTAVDVAMYGFLAILNRLYDFRLYTMIKPIFLLHDALILDIHQDANHAIPKIEKLGSTNLPKLENINFHLKATRL